MQIDEDGNQGSEEESEDSDSDSESEKDKMTSQTRPNTPRNDSATFQGQDDDSNHSEHEDSETSDKEEQTRSRFFMMTKVDKRNALRRLEASNVDMKLLKSVTKHKSILRCEYCLLHKKKCDDERLC